MMKKVFSAMALMAATAVSAHSLGDESVADLAKADTVSTEEEAAVDVTDSVSHDMADVFASLPDSILPLLSSVNRRDMLDFIANGMDARVYNLLKEETTLKVLNNDYALLEMSQQSRVEMKILQTTDSVPLLALVRTVEAPAADSHFELYDAEWHRLEWLEFQRPAIEDFWLPAPDSLATDAANAKLSLADLCLVEIKVSPDEPVFELVLDVSVLAEKEKDAAKLLVHPLQYLWDGTAFRKRD
ncbi:MAG: DUF3256 family protein [Prevotellaceae bacterium]|nr:DUF3256 family protein [Prevotellaceae bacterium]